MGKFFCIEDTKKKKHYVNEEDIRGFYREVIKGKTCCFVYVKDYITMSTIVDDTENTETAALTPNIGIDNNEPKTKISYYINDVIKIYPISQDYFNLLVRKMTVK